MTKEKDLVTREELEHIFDYDLENGKLYGKKPRSKKNKPGQEVGYDNRQGYLKFNLKGRDFRVHRVLFFLSEGYGPKEIDHINRIPSDNRINNLKESDRVKNNQNKFIQSNNTSGIVGVRGLENRNCGRSEIQFKGKKQSKTFKCVEDAIQGRKDKMEEFGFNPNHGDKRKE